MQRILVKLFSILALLALASCAPAAVPATGPSPTPLEASPTVAATSTWPAPEPTAARPTQSLAEGTATSEPTPAGTPVPLTQALLQADWYSNNEHPQLVPVDPNTGKALPGYTPVPLGGSYSLNLSPDRRTVVIVAYPYSGTPSNGALHFFDAANWQDRPTSITLDGWVAAQAISPNGSKLALATSDPWNTVRVIDVAKGTEIAGSKKLDQQIYALSFTRDGSGVMVFTGSSLYPTSTEAQPPRALLLDAATLQQRWSASLTGVRMGTFAYPHPTPVDLYSPLYGYTESPAFVFSPVSDLLYIIHADEDRLTTVDFAAQKVSARAIQPRLSLLDRLLNLGVEPVYAKSVDGNYKSGVISPDGQRIYIIGHTAKTTTDKWGQYQIDTQYTGLQVIDTGSAAELAKADAKADTIRITPDGSTLLLSRYQDAQSTQVVNASDLKTLANLKDVDLTPALTIGGQPVLVSSVAGSYQTMLAVVDPQTYGVIKQWKINDYAEWVH